MKEFKENFERGLTKGLRRFKTNPRNNQAMLDLHNWEPSEKGLKPKEDVEGLTIVTLPGDIDEGISLSDVFWFTDDCIPPDRLGEGGGPVVPPPEAEFPCVDAVPVAIASFPSVIAQDSSEGLSIFPGTPPYTWSVSGSGFSLDFAVTNNTSNVLNADAAACGAATIAVTDVCGFSVTGYVRSPVGQWVFICNSQDLTCCAISGEQQGKEGLYWYRIEGNKKTLQEGVRAGGGGCVSLATAEGQCAAREARLGEHPTCLTGHPYLDSWCEVIECDPPVAGKGIAEFYHPHPFVSALQHWEWEC